MQYERKTHSFLMRPSDRQEKAACRALLRGEGYTLVQRLPDGSLRFTPTNALIFNHSEYEFTFNDKTILRPLTKRAEQVCIALLHNSGFATIERVEDTNGIKLRFVSTNPVTENPWIVDNLRQPKDLTLGDQERE